VGPDLPGPPTSIHRLENCTGVGEEDRPGAAAFLTLLGYPMSVDALSELASAASGPEHRASGINSLYTHESLLKWASTRERVINGGDSGNQTTH
jgi:hypothetical protein